MADIPSDIIANQNLDAVLARMKSNPVLAGLKTDSSSVVHQALAPSALEIADLYREVQRALEMTSVIGVAGHRASGAWLDDYIRQRTGQVRIPATAAQVPVRFTGVAGTTVLAEYVVSTSGAVPIRFTLNANVVIGSGGTGDGVVTAQSPGSLGKMGNVGPGTITVLSSTVNGLSSVTNLTGPSILAYDTESDSALIARYLKFVADPPNGSNPAQYEQWALQVAGTGAAVALRPGEQDGPPGSRVDLYVADSNYRAASTAIVDAVQAYIHPPRTFTVEAETFTVYNANGVSTDATQIDDTGDSIKMLYSATAAGEIRYQFQTLLKQAGLWTVRPRIKVNSAAGSANLVTIEVYNVTNAAMAQTRQSGGVPATITLRGQDLLLAFSSSLLEFYSNITDTMELRIRRLQTDTTTQLWVDNVAWVSRFSNYDLAGKANATAIVQVLPAVEVPINVTVNVHAMPNAVQADVISAVTTSIVEYLSAHAYRSDAQGGNDIIYGEIGAAIQSSPGVQYYDPASLTINSAASNVVLAKRQLAVPGTTNVGFV